MRKEALDFPKSILIETFNVCQGECKFCPYKEIRATEEPIYLNFERYKELIDELMPMLSERTGRVPIILPVIMEIKARIINNNEEKDIKISSSLIDKIYEIIKETYLEKKEIRIDNLTNADNEKLSDFLTYIVAYPKDVETPKIFVSNKKIDDNNNFYHEFENRTLVCFSGGVDSTGALIKEIDEGKTPVAIWCNYGQPYKNPEKKAVEKICKKLNVPLIEAVLDLTDLIEIGGSRFGHVFPLET